MEVDLNVRLDYEKNISIEVEWWFIIGMVFLLRV